MNMSYIPLYGAPNCHDCNGMNTTNGNYCEWCQKLKEDQTIREMTQNNEGIWAKMTPDITNWFIKRYINPRQLKTQTVST